MNKTLEVVQRAFALLTPLPFPLIGCPRRNRWTVTPRSDSGMALLSLVGRRVSVPWDGGLADVFLTHDEEATLLFRPGKWRDWWIDDALLLHSWVTTETAISVPGVIVVHELDGRVQAVYVACPHDADLQRAYLERRRAWREGGEEAPPRWHRRHPRARYVCPKCPVRQRCEAVDLARGETSDWQ